MTTLLQNRFSNTGLHHLWKVGVGVLVLAAFFLVGLAPQSVQAQQQTFTVDSNGDANDASVGDGNCATAGGNCTLRAAIQEANDDGANDTIEFSIPTTGTFATISPSTEFAITNPVTIDGTTAPSHPSSVGGGGPVIVLDGSSLSSSSDDGIQIEASNTTIRGLAINSFPDEGIDVFDYSGVTIEQCFVGIAADDGTSDRGNLTNSDGLQDAGVDLAGDDYILQNNVISHNNGDGVRSSGSSTGSAPISSENIIGLTADGTSAAGNDGAGFRVAGGTGVVVGLAQQTISGNSGPGIVIESDNNSILTNYVGTNVAGDAAIGNGEDGIRILGDGNTLSGNVVSGTW